MTKTEWALATLLALAFLPGGIALARVWLSVDYYSHGFLVPLFALWVAHQRGHLRGRRALAREPRGTALLAVAILVYALGLVSGSAAVQGVALVAAVTGGVLYLWGREQLRALVFPLGFLLFPLGFLLFMVPLPASWLNPLIVELQLLVSSAALDLLHAFDFTIAREGNVLLLPGGQSLFVSEACSGITSIVVLTPLAVALAYLSERSWARRLAIVAAAVPAAMLGNLARVLVTAVAADAYGVERATDNALHEFAGLLTFAFSCLLLIGVGPLLRLLSRARVPGEA
jgi:exosortase